jgi:hypothetical protein
MSLVNFHSFKPEQGSHRYEGVDGHFPALELCLKTLSPACPSHWQTPRRHKSHLALLFVGNAKLPRLIIAKVIGRKEAMRKLLKPAPTQPKPFPSVSGKFSSAF